jgi:hypothetical protein
MLEALRKRVTPATVIGVIALVFAFTGGALAAKKYVITSTKQISPTVLKKLTGKPGPQGPQGLQGGSGPAGKNGANGTNGTNGVNGETGFTEVLPPGKSLTGTWSSNFVDTGGESTALQYVPISFGIPLAKKLEVTDVHFIALGEETGTGDCPGSIEEPEAAPGKLCIYTSTEEVAAESSLTPGGFDIPEPGNAGAVLKFVVHGFVILHGTWIATAPLS